MINYEEILKKYMKFIFLKEGCDFLEMFSESDSDSKESELTKEELNKLVEISDSLKKTL